MKFITQKSFLKMFAKPVGMLFLVFLLALDANAQTTFNNANGTGVWSDPLNWDTGLPNTGINAIIQDGETCIVDIPSPECAELFVGDGSLGTPAILQVNANGIVLSAKKVTVIALCRIEVTGPFNFKLIVTDGTIELNNATCFVPGNSTLALGSGGSTPPAVTSGTIIVPAVATVINLFNLEIDLGTGKPFTQGPFLGLNISNNLILTSGEFNNGAGSASTLVVGGDLVVPVPGGTIARVQQTNTPIFDLGGVIGGTTCTNTTTSPLTVNAGSTLQVRDVKIANGATLTFRTSTYLKVSRNWGDSGNLTGTGAISTGGTVPTIEFNGATQGETIGAIDGNHVNFSSAFVVINKATGVKFIATSGIISTNRFAIKSGDFFAPGGSPQFNDMCISGGDFQNISSSTAAVSGNWTLVETGTFFKGNPTLFPGNNTKIKFVGTTKSIIKITPTGIAAVNQLFRTLIIAKTGPLGIVENAAGPTNGTVIRAEEGLSVESGLLFINEVTVDVPAFNQVPGYTVVHADGTSTNVPAADLEVRAKFVIDGGAGVNFTNVLAAGVPIDTDAPSGLLTLWVGNELRDKNASEPTATTGFYTGRPTVLGALTIPSLSIRPVVVFTGDDDIIVAGGYLLRNALDQNVGTPRGIVLPNVIIASQTPFVTVRTVTIGIVATTGGMRVLGDMVVCAGYRFSTNGNDFYFGDRSNNNTNLDITDILDVFGRMVVSAGSTFYMATGNDERGTFFRVRQGGQVSFDGTAAKRVTVARDVQAGRYYRMCAYSGSKVNVAYTDFAFQGASNDGFFPTLPASQNPQEFNYGTTTALQNALNNGVAGVNRNFLGDFVNSASGTRAGEQSKGGFKILQGASIGTADVLVAGTPDLPVPIPGGGSAKRNFTSCSFQAGASCFTGVTINTGQALDIYEAVFVGSSGGNNAGCDFNIVNFYDDYKDNDYNTDGVAATELNIIYCYGCLGARAGSLGEVYDGGYIAGAPTPNPTTTGRGDGENRVQFLANQLIWWTGEANTNSWDNINNWTVDKTNIIGAIRPNVAPGKNGALKTEVNRAAYIVFIRAKVIAGEVFQADGVTPYPLAPLYDVGLPVIGTFVRTEPRIIGGTPVTIFVIRYKQTGETNRDYEVFIPNDGNVATPLVDIDNPVFGFPDVWITGSLLINGVRDTTPGLNATIGGGGATVNKTVDIGNKILRVENDAIGIGNGGIRYTGTAAAVGTSGVLELGGNLSFYFGGTYQKSNDFSLLRLITNSIQQVRLAGNRDISNLIINKVIFDPLNVQVPGSEGGGVIFQGGATAMPIKFDLTITTGSLTMFSETPLVVERHTTIEANGSVDLLTAYAVFGGNFTNRGQIAGGRRIFFTPINTTIGAANRTITTGGKVLPPVSFLNGSIPWSGAGNTGLITTFGIGGNNVYATGAGVSNSVFGLVVYDLLDNFITSGAGGNAPNTPNPQVEIGTIIQNNRRVNSSDNTTLRFFAPIGASGINVLKIENGGILNITPGVKLEIDALSVASVRTLFVENGGLLQAIGTGITSSLITRYGSVAAPTARFAFTIEGSIRARFYTFEFMDRDGVNMSTATTARALDIDVNGDNVPTLFGTTGGINDERCFSNCTFTNGTSTGTFLKVHNAVFPNYGAGINVPRPYPASSLYIENVSFPSPLASGSNVAWVNAGAAKGAFPAAPVATDNKLIFNLATGGYAGENFDSDFDTSILDGDANNCIRWIEPNVITWTGASNGAAAGTLAIDATTEAARASATDWNDAENWLPIGVPGINDNVVLDRTNFDLNNITVLDYKVIISANANIKSLKMAQVGGGSPTAINNRRIILQVGTAGTPATLQVEQTLTVTRAATSTNINDGIIMTANAASQLNVGTTWSNDGRFINGSVNDPDGNPVTAISSTLTSSFPTGSLTLAGVLNGGAIVNFNRPNQRGIYNGSPLASDATNTKFNAFNNVTFIGAPTNLNSNMYVQGNLAINNFAGISGKLSANNGNFVIDIKGNWTNNGVFDPTSGRVDFTGTTNQTVVRNYFYEFVVNGSATVKQPEIFTNVRLLKTAGLLTLNSRVLISNNGNMNLSSGIIVASTSNELIIDSDSGISSGGGTSHVVGPVARIFNSEVNDINLTYPVGDAEGFYADVEFRARLIRGLPTALSITQIVGVPVTTPIARILPSPFNAIGQRCYWNVKNINFPITNNISQFAGDTSNSFRTDLNYGQIKLNFDPSKQVLPPPLGPNTISSYNLSDVNGAAATVETNIIQTPAADALSVSMNPTLADRRGFGPMRSATKDSWIVLGGVANDDFDGNAVAITSGDFFHLGNGDFALAYRFIPLPVELIDFNGKYVDDRVRLNWVVTSEKDVVSYTVSRSSNGRTDSFVEIGTVAADTNPATINMYGLDDFSSFSGINYYRLAQTDKDGTKRNISKIIAVTNKKNLGDAQMLLYPNPSDNGKFSINIPERNEMTTISVYGLTGAKVFEQEIKSTDNGKIENIDASKYLNKGLYVVRVKVADKTYQTKLSIN